MTSKLAKSFTLLFALVFAFITESYATSCGWATTSIDEVITDQTIVFRGKPIYYSQRTKPGSSYGWSTVFEVNELMKGDVGSYGNYRKVYHGRGLDMRAFQYNASYLIVAEKQGNGNLIKKGGWCGLNYEEDEVLEYIKTGNPNNAVPIGCEQDIRIAIKSEFLEGKLSFYEKKCLRYVPAFKRKYPEFVKKYARKK